MIRLRTVLFLACAACLWAQSDQEYGGPSILSRGLAASNSPIGNTSFLPFVSLGGVVDSGITRPVANLSTNLGSGTDEGVMLAFGLTGRHNWKKTSLWLEYRGDLLHYANASSLDTSDQLLTLGVVRQQTKHVQFILRESAGTYTRNYNVLTGNGLIDPSLLETPSYDVYDNRVIFCSTALDAVIQKTARLSFDFGAQGFLVRRQSTALYGVTGAVAHGDIAYRLNRRSTIGAVYRFTRFDFAHTVGTTDIQSAGLTYSLRVSRNWEFSSQLAAARVDSVLLTQVQIDPEIAAILGQSVGQRIAIRVHVMPDVKARLDRDFHRGNLSFDYERGIRPGNGIYLSVGTENATGTYTYNGLHEWSLGMHGGYMRFTPLVQDIGVYQGVGWGFGASRKLKASLSLVVRADIFHNNAPAVQLIHDRTRVTMGFAWSPGERPLPAW